MAILVIGDDKTKAIPVLEKGGSTPVVSPLDVTPSTSAQQFIPSTGTDGYNPVNVAAVTNSIDANIVADNIVKGTTILGVTGTAPKMINGLRTLNQNGVYNTVDPSSNTFISQISVVVTPNVSGTLNITSNGPYDVRNYASVDVNVSGGSGLEYIVDPIDIQTQGIPQTIEREWQQFLNDEIDYLALYVTGEDINNYGRYFVYPVFYDKNGDIISLYGYFGDDGLFSDGSYLQESTPSSSEFHLDFYSSSDGMHYELFGNIYRQ